MGLGRTGAGVSATDDSKGTPNPGPASPPDLDVWRAEAGEAARLTVHIPKAPWRYGFSDGAFAFRDVVGDAKGRGFVRGESSAEWPAIGAFIAAARTGWPRDAARVAVLCAEVERLRAALAVAERAASLCAGEVAELRAAAATAKADREADPCPGSRGY